MATNITKERKELKISAGLLVGYMIGGLLNMIFFDKSFQEAFSNRELLLSVVGIAISLFIIIRFKRITRTVQLPPSS